MARGQAGRTAQVLLALAMLVAGAALTPRPARAASNYPSIKIWALVGAFQDSTTLPRGARRCLGAMDPRPDSLRIQARTISIRFLRDREAEARPDFGGYRLYRMIGTPDPSKAVLLRRFSANSGAELTWHFSNVDATTLEFMCQGAVVHDSIVTFMDPDSSGNYVKVCRRIDAAGHCIPPIDSIFMLVSPPGPHDGFRTYYSITYEARNGSDATYEEAFVPDTLDNFARCGTSGLRDSCPNLNSRLRNMVGPIEPTGGPTPNLETVGVVPNPYRASEVWDPAGQNEIHFINLPRQATIKIYTVSGDLVRELHHNDPVRDFEIWDLDLGRGTRGRVGHLHLPRRGCFLQLPESLRRHPLTRRGPPTGGPLRFPRNGPHAIPPRSARVIADRSSKAGTSCRRRCAMPRAGCSQGRSTPGWSRCSAPRPSPSSCCRSSSGAMPTAGASATRNWP